MDLRRALGLNPEQAEENVVNYELYLRNTNGTLRELVEEEARGLQLQLLEHTLQFTEDYIWQRGRWDLHVTGLQSPPWHVTAIHSRGKMQKGADAEKQEVEVQPHLWGSVAFGDNVEDEWFIVWLLLELTKAFPVTARVWDNDGEFLLIEAAYSLPRWLKPEAAANRVWLHGGTLHIVPQLRVAGHPLIPSRPTCREALEMVQGDVVDTATGPKVMASILQRLEGFPQRAQQLMHSVRVVVPALLAHVLKREPHLLAPAVEAFHFRDVDDMRVAARMSRFPPSDVVPLRATFSRCLYAQLALQQFNPVRTYPMPMPSDPQFKAAEVGMKLAAGFEMLAADTQRREHPLGGGGDESSQQWATSEQPLDVNADLLGFLAALQQDSLLRGKEGVSSEDALRRYKRVQAYCRRAAELAVPVARLHQLLQETPDPPESYPPFNALPPDDSDDWLREGASALDSDLQRRQQEFEQDEAWKNGRKQGQATGAAGLGLGAADFDPDMLASRLRQFVDTAAGLEGAEVARDDGDLDLDETSFAAELERVLGMKPGTFGNLVGADVSSESSEEGSSFYSSTGSEEESDAEEELDTSTQQRSLQQDPQQESPTWAPAGPAVRPGVPAGSAWAEELWEVATATDSDDEGADGLEKEGGAGSGRYAEVEGEGEEDLGDFMDAYSRAMQAQLASTTLGRSFVRADGQQEQRPASANAATAADKAPAGEQQQSEPEDREGGAAVTPGRGNGGDAAEELQPIDIDLNVVEGLLASFHSQQGLPGPASNLAGMLGISLPPPTPPK